MLMDKTLWARFGEATLTAPHAIQWLSDNGRQYTATVSVLYAHALGLVPIATPAYSPGSNGLASMPWRLRRGSPTIVYRRRRKSLYIHDPKVYANYAVQ